MSGALGLRVPYSRGEAPQSLLSRLAACNGVSMRELCAHMRLSVYDVANGDPAAIAKLARLADADVVALSDEAMVRSGSGGLQRWTFRGETLVRGMMRRWGLKVCPHCLREDILASDRPAEEVVRCRPLWLVEQVRTCDVHGVALVDLPIRDRGDIHDVSKRFRMLALDGPGLLAAGVPRRPSALEAYVVDRLAGVRRSPWMDGLPLHVAALTAERIGAVSLFGPKVNFKELDDHAWHVAGCAGFEVVADGAEGFATFVRAMQPPGTQPLRSDTGTYANFGALWPFLRHASDDPAFGPVCGMMAAQMAGNRPIRPDKVILGVRPELAVNSLSTAALIHRSHPKTLRKVLAAAGVLPAGHEALSPSQVVFDGGRAAAALGALRSRVKLTVARDHLGAPNSQAALLLEAGFIEADATVPRRKGDPLFVTQSSVDRFLERLREGAEDRDVAERGELSLFAAAQASRRPLAEVTGLVVGRRLSWVGNLTTRKGFSAVLVRQAEVMAAFGFVSNTRLTKWDVRKKLMLSYEAVMYLTEHRHIRSRKVRQTRMEFFFDVVEPRAMRAFDARYASVALLARERGLHPHRLRGLLAKAGVEPAFPVKTLNCAVFRRRDVPAEM